MPKVKKKVVTKKTKKAKAKKSKKVTKKIVSIKKDKTIKNAETEEVFNETEDVKALAPSDPVTRYIAEIRKYPLLSKEDEHNWAVKYFENKDPKAAEVLVTSNLRFVVKVAAEYSKFGAKMIDLVQEGNVGLMHAVREFNPYKGVRLITYAVWWIRGYIQDFLMKQYSLVRIGTTQNQRKLFYQLQKQKRELQNLGFDTGIKQLSGKLGIPEEEVKTMSQRMSGRDVSLDQPIGDNNSSTLIDLQKDDYEVAIDDELGLQEEIQLLTENIEKVRPQLNDRELYLLENRLLSDSPLTLQDIGDKYGITREAVRQMENRLISKIKKEMFPES
ncbi:MAG: RNA polymerase factor sigma-32 [Bdellovibrionales bacterium]|nr:RNA polymerase factor sigma-32 [Bdellovibrionales bacterium]